MYTKEYKSTTSIKIWSDPSSKLQKIQVNLKVFFPKYLARKICRSCPARLIFLELDPWGFSLPMDGNKKFPLGVQPAHNRICRPHNVSLIIRNIEEKTLADLSEKAGGGVTWEISYYIGTPLLENFWLHSENK